MLQFLNTLGVQLLSPAVTVEVNPPEDLISVPLILDTAYSPSRSY